MSATIDKYDAVLESITSGGIATIPVIPDEGESQDQGVDENPDGLNEEVCPHCKRPMDSK
jgi:hypothetical protein